MSAAEQSLDTTTARQTVDAARVSMHTAAERWRQPDSTKADRDAFELAQVQVSRALIRLYWARRDANNDTTATAAGAQAPVAPPTAPTPKPLRPSPFL